MTATQIRRSECPAWVCGLPPDRARPATESAPYERATYTETAVPGLCKGSREVRRRDVGPQKYGSAVPATRGTRLKDGLYDRSQRTLRDTHMTPRGPIAISSSRHKYGFLPTADAVNILKHEYQDTRLSPPHPRYY
jgi:hypothetical protein